MRAVREVLICVVAALNACGIAHAAAASPSLELPHASLVPGGIFIAGMWVCRPCQVLAVDRHRGVNRHGACVEDARHAGAPRGIERIEADHQVVPEHRRRTCALNTD